MPRYFAPISKEALQKKIEGILKATPNDVPPSDICPKCRKPARWRHLHDAAHGLVGTHLAGSERYECQNCHHDLYRAAGIQIGLTYVYED